MAADRPRLALLDASHGAEHTPRNFRRELAADLVEYDASAGDIPDGFGFDGAVITGSRASVYWEEAWIDDLRAWVREADGRLPLFGVCFGHQILADALGGTVEGMGDYEIGYREIERLEREGESPLLSGVDRRFVAFTTHSDEVTELPPGATALAETDRSVHAFQRDASYGVQFHPEYDAATARTVTRGKEDQLSAERLEAVLDGITEETVRAAAGAKQVFDNVLAVVREREAASQRRA
jgi:GMP synthase (glutamine-hydrolysing)